jgi:hypothetical protein
VNFVYGLLAAMTGVDWNNNGVIDPYPAVSVARDLNRRRDTDSHPGDTLEDHDDWLRLAYGFRLDADYADGVHLDTTDTIEMTLQDYNAISAIPPPIADVYCVGKLHSGGCTPQMEWTGIPSASSQTPFVVRAEFVKPNVFGLLFYGYQPKNVPFQGGTLCVGNPIMRTGNQNTGGTGACGGTIAVDFNARIQSGIDPGLQIGVQVFCQVEFRDLQDPAGFAIGLSNALRLTIQP